MMACSKDTPTCSYLSIVEKWHSADHISKCCRKNLFRMLADVNNIFRDNGLHFWIDYGSLLGIVRHRKIIPWDKDVDFGIFAKDLDHLASLQPKLKEKGYDFIKTGGCDYFGNEAVLPRIYFSKTNRLYCDIYLWEYTPDGQFCHMIAHPFSDGSFHLCPKHFYENIQSYKLLGINFMVPDKREEYLALRYGDNWRIPDPYFYVNK
jgi:phosphorylcholine metabolism protein LicD